MLNKFNTNYLMIRYLIILYFFILGAMFYLVLPVTKLFILIDILFVSYALLQFFTKQIILKKKQKRILYVFITFYMISFISYFFNRSDTIMFVKTFRFLAFPFFVFLMFNHKSLTEKHFIKIKKLFFFIGYLQGPISIFQKMIYSSLPAKYKIAQFVDYASGSIGGIMSGVLALFITFLVVIKTQEMITYGFNRKRILQLLLLLSPNIVIQSTAQYFILPLVFFFIFFINKKLNKNFIKLTLLAVLSLVFIDYFMSFYTKSTLFVKLQEINYFTESNVSSIRDYKYHSINRLSQIRYFLNQPLSLFGDGTGKYYEAYSYRYSIDNNSEMFALNNQFVKTYAETGLLGLVMIIMILIVFYRNLDNSTYGKTMKSITFIMFLNLFYINPFTTYQIMITYFFFYTYYLRFNKNENIKHSNNIPLRSNSL